MLSRFGQPRAEVADDLLLAGSKALEIGLDAFQFGAHALQGPVCFLASQE